MRAYVCHAGAPCVRVLCCVCLLSRAYSLSPSCVAPASAWSHFNNNTSTHHTHPPTTPCSFSCPPLPLAALSQCAKNSDAFLFFSFFFSLVSCRSSSCVHWYVRLLRLRLQLVLILPLLLFLTRLSLSCPHHGFLCCCSLLLLPALLRWWGALRFLCVFFCLLALLLLQKNAHPEK